jgi:hypothetical protein
MKRSKVQWCISITLLLFTVMAGAHQFQSSREWQTIDLPNPEGFLPYTDKAKGSASLPLKLELVATQDAWVEVETDGHNRYKNLVRAHQTLAFGASERIRVKTGNAPAVKLRFNGELAAAAGSKRVRAVEFTSGGVRDLNSAYAVTSL